MARRTKADALATHDNILDSAELLFLRQGVSRTTLSHIAAGAGVSRGAIYWHFEDKAALFNAMMERARMPLESAMQLLDLPHQSDPLGCLTDYATLVFRLTVSDPKARGVFEIATLKIEYVDEMTSVRLRRAEMANRWMAAAESRIRFAVHAGHARRNVDPRAVALGLWSIIDGLLRAWMINPNSFNLVTMGGHIVETHLDAIRQPGKGSRGATIYRPALAIATSRRRTCLNSEE
jgi:TetR/AcrR family acrAB operon transcriptional repressor